MFTFYHVEFSYASCTAIAVPTMQTSYDVRAFSQRSKDSGTNKRRGSPTTRSRCIPRRRSSVRADYNHTSFVVNGGPTVGSGTCSST